MVQKKHRRDTRFYKETYYTPMNKILLERQKLFEKRLREIDDSKRYVFTLNFMEETTRLMVEEFKKIVLKNSCDESGKGDLISDTQPILEFLTK